MNKRLAFIAMCVGIGVCAGNPDVAHAQAVAVGQGPGSQAPDPDGPSMGPSSSAPGSEAPGTYAAAAEAPKTQDSASYGPGTYGPGTYQPNSFPPPPLTRPPGPSVRRRLMLGATLGVGGMDSDRPSLVACYNCDSDPGSGGASAHLGVVMSDNLALLLELSVTIQNLERQGDISIAQGLAVVAAQYWINRRIWLKGGLGRASLSRQFRNYGETIDEMDVASGAAILAAAGYELLSRRKFALVLQFRIQAGSYHGNGDGFSVTSGTINLGFSWFP